MVESTNNTPPDPPQMRNGGSPPAHLSSSSLSDPSWWLQFKWSQPPPRAPEWLFDYYERYNPPPLDAFGRPLRIEDWHQRAIREDQQASGLLPPGPRGGPILHGWYARAERAYKDWKGAIDDMWADEHHRLVKEQAARARQEEAARRTQLLHEQDARARQVARRQQLLNEEAARARQEEAAARARQEEATRRLQLLNEQAARARQEAAARARQEEASRRQMLLNEAARTIFLWLRRCYLHVRLTRQTARRQHRKAALARLRYEDACQRRVALAEAKCREDTLAEDKRHHDEAKRRADALRCITARNEWVLAELAESAKRAKAADEQRHHEAATRSAESADLALVEGRRHHEAVLAAECDKQQRKPTNYVVTRLCWRRRPTDNVGTRRPHGLWSPRP